MASCEATELVVFQMRKMRPDKINPCFSKLTAHHGHPWEFCMLPFGVPGGGGPIPVFLKNSQGGPKVQPDLKK